MVEFVVVTGLSGAGRTQVGNTLEDLGWFVIDNLPSELIPKVAELARFQSDAPTPVGLVVGSEGDLFEVGPALDELRSTGATVTTVFLDASTPTLVRRYGDTRRRHPLLGEIGSVEGAIQEERDRLGTVRGSADVVIDTSDLNVHDLRRRVVELFGDAAGRDTTQVTILSFGYKHGVPPDADLVFDCRFLPNPHWVEGLRPMTGLDAPVQEYVASFDLTGRVPRPAVSAAGAAPAGVPGGGQVPADHRVRVHRGPPSVGVDGGADRAVAPRTGHRAPAAPPGRGQVSSTAGPAVVAIGGGHGLAASLRAVRTYTSQVTAVVSVADDGGSTGSTPGCRRPPGARVTCASA